MWLLQVSVQSGDLEAEHGQSKDGADLVMRRALKRGGAAAVVCTAAVGVSGGSAQAYVQVCSGPAQPGCATGGYHSYVETRSMKTGAAANQICTGLVQSNGILTYACLPNTTFVKTCVYNQLTYGVHWGSSNQWTVSGRDEAGSDVDTCPMV